MCTIGIIGALTLNISLVTELLNFGGLVGFMCKYFCNCILFC